MQVFYPRIEPIWTLEDDARLKEIMALGSEPNFSVIAKSFPGRSDQDVRKRWEMFAARMAPPPAWTVEEDRILIVLNRQFKNFEWSPIAAKLTNRSVEQVRERWAKLLLVAHNKAPFTEIEDRRIIDLHEIYGDDWTRIASNMPGRSEESIKERWMNVLNQSFVYAPLFEDQQDSGDKVDFIDDINWGSIFGDM